MVAYSLIELYLRLLVILKWCSLSYIDGDLRRTMCDYIGSHVTVRAVQPPTLLLLFYYVTRQIQFSNFSAHFAAIDGILLNFSKPFHLCKVLNVLYVI